MPRVSVRDSVTSLVFNGTTASVTPTTMVSLTGTFDITWKSKFSDNATLRSIFGNITDPSGAKISYGASAGKFAIRVINGGTLDQSVTLSSTNKWTTYNLVRDSSNVVTLYENGVLKGTLYSGAAQVGTYNFDTIGRATGTSGFFGVLDEVRVYNVSHTASEISQMYFNNIIPRTGLMGEWLFNEGSGTTALDSSGNGNNGTITGATYTTDVPFKPRVAASNKLSVQNMNASLSFAAVSDRVDAGTDFIGTGDVTVGAWINPSSLGGGNGARIIDNGKINFQLTVGNKLNLQVDGATNTSTSTDSIAFNKWRYVLFTATSAGVVNFRVNGNASGTANQAGGTRTAGSTNVFIGNNNAINRNFNGKLKDLKVFNRILTTAEQDALMSGINPTDYSTSIVRDFSLNEGAGTTIYSKNNTALTGTITGATWSSDTPVKTRNQVGGNLVKNGDLSYVPVVNVAGNTSSTLWIDGTASGSATNSLFGFVFYRNAATADCIFDKTTLFNGNPTLKFSTYDVTGAGFFDIGPGIAASISVTNVQRGIKILPSTSYTLTGWIKTNNVPTNGAFIQFTSYDANGTRFDNIASTKLAGTNDWTFISLIVTSSASARFATVGLMRNVAGTISDTWFANITLKPTINIVRTNVS